MIKDLFEGVWTSWTLSILLIYHEALCGLSEWYIGVVLVFELRTWGGLPLPQGALLTLA